MDPHHKPLIGMASWLVTGIGAHIVSIDAVLQGLWYIAGIAAAVATYLSVRKHK